MHELSEIKKVLQESELFDGLGHDSLTLMAGSARIAEYQAGETIIWESEQVDSFHLVIEGQVKLFKSSPDGKEQTLYVFGPGEPFCLCARLVCDQFPASAAALIRSRVLILPVELLDELTRQDPSFLFNILAVVSRRLMESMRLVESLALKDIPARIASFLLHSLQSRDEQELGKGVIPSHLAPTISLFVTQRELAKMLGATPEALSRTLKRMSSKELIRVEPGGRAITLLDMDALMSMAGE